MSAENLYNRAIKALNRGNWLEAFQYLRESIQMYPDYIPSYLEMAKLSYALGHYGFTKEVIEEALKQNPSEAETNFMMGNLLYKEGKYRRAIAYYLKAQGPDGHYSAETLYNIGLCYRRLGDMEKAIACFRLAVEASDEMEEAKLSLGCCLREVGEIKEAEDLLWSVIEMNPYIPEAYHQLGLIYAQRKEWIEAIEMWEEALLLEPKKTETLREIGWAHYMLGNRELALEYLEACVRINPENINARFDLCIVYLNGMQISEAIEHLEAILKRFPDNKLAQRYLREAKKLQRSPEKGAES